MHTLFAHPVFARGILLTLGGLLRRVELARESALPVGGDRALVFWSSGTHSRRADEAARDRPAGPQSR